MESARVLSPRAIEIASEGKGDAVTLQAGKVRDTITFNPMDSGRTAVTLSREGGESLSLNP